MIRANYGSWKADDERSKLGREIQLQDHTCAPSYQAALRRWGHKHSWVNVCEAARHSPLRTRSLVEHTSSDSEQGSLKNRKRKRTLTHPPSPQVSLAHQKPKAQTGRIITFKAGKPRETSLLLRESDPEKQWPKHSNTRGSPTKQWTRYNPWSTLSLKCFSAPILILRRHRNMTKHFLGGKI